MSQDLQDISNLIRNETEEGGNTKERIASAFDTVNTDKLDSGGSTKTGAQLENETPVFNLTNKLPLESGYYTSETARTTVPIDIRKYGLIITYAINDKKWITEQYIGSDLTDWVNNDNWKSILYHKIYQSGKYIGVISDADGRILQAIKVDGTPYFPKHELLIKTDNDLYLYCISDADGRILFGIRKDGTVYIPKLKDSITPSEREFITLFKDILHIKSDNKDYLFYLVDDQNRIVGYLKKDGTMYFPKLELTEQNYLSIDKQNPIIRENTDVIQLPMPTTLATVNIVSDRISELTTGKNSVPAIMEYNDHNGNFLRIDVEIAWQGSSSINNPKKNFSIDLPSKLQFGDWVAQDGFHFKAEYMDATRSRNNVCMQIVEQVYLTRSWLNQRPWRVPYAIDDKTLVNRFDTGAKGHIEGFFFEMYVNGGYQGLYNFNMKKHRDNYQMDKSNNNHILLEMAGGNQSIIQYPVDWTKWEIRNPKGFDANVEPSAGVVKTAIERFFTWAGSVTNANFDAECDQYLNMPFWIDFELIKQFAAAADWDRNNTLIGTHDGLVWSPYMYDGDSIFGLYSLGTVLHDGTYPFPTLGQLQNVEKVLQVVRQTDIEVRYKELRDSGIFTTKNVMTLFNTRMKVAGFESIKRDLAKWWETPSNRDDSQIYPSPPLYTGGSYTGLGQLEDWLDKRIALLDNKYNY